MDWMNGKINEATNLVENGFLLAAAVIIGLAAWQSRSIIKTLTAALLCGVALWAINNVGWFENKVDQEAAMVVVVDETPGAAGRKLGVPS